MLDLDARTQVDRWVHSLPCQVKLPDGRMTEKVARALTTPEDHRRYARLICRGPQLRAALKYATTFSALPRSADWHGVYTLDVSRGGCGFLHSEPLFPGERMEIVLFGGMQHDIKIVRCVRWEDHCFAVGARFTGRASADADMANDGCSREVVAGPGSDAWNRNTPTEFRD